MSLRRIALDVLLEITQGGKYANLALESALKSAEHTEAAWVIAFVYETLDRLILIDYIIDAHAKGKMNPKIRTGFSGWNRELYFLRQFDYNIPCSRGKTKMRCFFTGNISG